MTLALHLLGSLRCTKTLVSLTNRSDEQSSHEDEVLDRIFPLDISHIPSPPDHTQPPIIGPPASQLPPSRHNVANSV
eukprot:scaffold3786_cov204-Alexandrium_tamarense.AAC.36